MKESSSIAIQRDGIQSNISAPATSRKITHHKSEIVVRAIIWGFVGSIFGGLYIGFTSMLEPLALGHLVMIPAAAFAGAVGAAFYGSFQVAIIGTLAGAASGIGYMVAVENLHMNELAMLSLFAGIVAGFLYGNTHDAVSGALMKALTGLIAGTIAGCILWVVTSAGITFNSFLAGALLVPITGTFYIYGIFQIISKLECKLPLPLVGSVVAGALSLVIASSIWTVHEAVLTSYQVIEPSIGQVGFKQIMGAILGGAMGGLIAGGLYAWVGLKWLDRN
ncbi:hypothetical protein [Sedimenticola selenatireducens]|uniref:Uncharacterized protein n=1 Tax=Sedimenticola selenatireducens TaxID=191960 RepID=A0A558DPT5_9GAMM|nr:hypothetical protein [Sedimenticola selenatireducens]TVO70443.1 hypothetical protein FHP88_16275 [Sedimenticola selenatireducens]TVT63020.1 MAG: hypothetical protein FHK78_12650 [Sedimenticola selenatireducens]